MKKIFLALAALSFSFPLTARDSITEQYYGYREICFKASTDPYYFGNFRSMSEYRIALELTEADQFAEYVKGSPRLLDRIEACRPLEKIGNPLVTDYPVLGPFSGTTLRYMVLVDQIQKFCNPPSNAKIVEIGAGFGGQAFVLSRFLPYSKYYIYDLPEVEALINRVAQELSMDNIYCMPIKRHLPEDRIDLVISNYAFSEIERKKQLDYFDRVIRKADRGFIIYNQIAKGYDIDSMSPDEFVTLLKAHGFKPKVMREYPSTSPDNILITWKK